MRYVSEPEFWGGDAKEIELWPYQEESVAELKRLIREGAKCLMLASMVGSGKTIMAAWLLLQCLNKGDSGVFVVDRINLLDQTSAVLDRYGIPHGVWHPAHGKYKPGELIQVASIQTISRRGWPKADLIVNDEAHVVYKTMMRKIEVMDAKVIIGLSATPFTKGLGKYYKGIVNVRTGNQLTEEGVLVPYKVWAAAEPDMAGAKVVAGEWTDEEASKRSIKIVGDVVKEYQRHGQGRKTIVFGVDVAHCQALQAQFMTAGIVAQLYTYREDAEEKTWIVDEFRKPNSSIRMLISVAALSRGFDVPDVGCIIMCRPLKASFAEFVQILGRGLRAHKPSDKQDCTILDLAGNFMRHYPALLEFMEEGVNHLDDGKKKASKPAVKRERKPVKCPKCTFVFGGGPNCPACGHIFAIASKVIHAQGELAGFDGEKSVRMGRMEKIRLCGELKHIAEAKGYKFGWVARMFRMFAHSDIRAYRSGPITPRPETAEKVHRAMTYRKPKKKPATAILAQPRGALAIDLFA